MVDIEVALETRIDLYRKAAERTRRSAFMDDEYGYHQSAQLNKGQQFVYEFIVDDLEKLLAQIKEG